MNNALFDAICRAEVLAYLGDVDSVESQPTRSSGLPRSNHSAWRLPAFAARGLKNREIAENLVLSVRTVESRLRNACQKLGVDNRNGLPAVIAH